MKIGFITISRKNGKTEWDYDVKENYTSYKPVLLKLLWSIPVVIACESILYAVDHFELGLIGRILDIIRIIIIVVFLNYLLYISVELEQTSKNIKKLKAAERKQQRRKSSGKQYSLEELMNVLRRDDICEIEILTLSGEITIGTSAECKPDGFEFYDKRYYISDNEFELDEEPQFINELIQLVGGETITVLSVDGCKA